MELDYEQALIFLYKVTPRVTHARERRNRANEFIVTSLFAIALAEKRTGPRILRENADCKQVRCGRLRPTLRSLFPTVFLFSSFSQVTNNCKNNRYILQQVTRVQYDSILK